MRRVPAVMLVSLIGFSLIGPALFVDAEANLPACCRRNGAHRCAMMNMDPSMADLPSGGLGVRAQAIRCPFFPRGGALLPHSGPALLAASYPAYVVSLAQFTVQAQAEAGYRTSLGRSHQKRGPPTLLS